MKKHVMKKACSTAASFFKRRGFVLTALTFCILLFLFHTWLAWPGFIHNDTPHSVLLIKDNAHPVILAYTLELLYKLFGTHIYYMLLMNLVPFYLGLFIFSWAFYKKFHSFWALSVLGLAGIGNIFFQNFIMHSSSLSPMMIFLVFALVFYAVLNPIRGRIKRALFWGFTGCIFLFALMTRHNAFVQIAPLVILGLAFFNKKHPLSLFTNIILLCLSCLLIIGWSVGIPKLLQRIPSYPAQHIFLHQIAGACVPANDATCFKDEWYQPGANFEKVKQEYRDWPFWADRFSTLQPRYQVFKGNNLEGLCFMWFRAIFKYPLYYLHHVFRFLTKMWFQPVSFESENYLQRKMTDTFFYSWFQKSHLNFPSNEHQIVFTQTKIKLYATLWDALPIIPTIFWILILFYAFGRSCLSLKRHPENTLLWYIFATAGGGIAGSFIFTLFSPTAFYRYIHPVCVSALAALFGTIAYFLTQRKKTIQIHPFLKACLLIGICFWIHAVYLCFYRPLARIDFETPKQQTNPFEVYVVPARNTKISPQEIKLIWTPWWMEQYHIYGRAFESNKGVAHLNLHIFSPSEIKIILRGEDSIDSKDRRLNKKVSFYSLKINNVEVLQEPQIIWHDHPFIYTLQGSPGLVQIDAAWHKTLD